MKGRVPTCPICGFIQGLVPCFLFPLEYLSLFYGEIDSYILASVRAYIFYFTYQHVLDSEAQQVLDSEAHLCGYHMRWHDTYVT